MDRNRNIDFDSNVEMDSLKDAVWRLSTRVYILEDFIAERFGEVLGPSGFSRTTSGVPLNISCCKTTDTNGDVEDLNASSRISRGLKRRRRQPRSRHGINTEAKRKHLCNVIPNNQKSARLESVKTLEPSFIGVDPLDFERDSNILSSVPIPKIEVFELNFDQPDGNDEFLNKSIDNEDDLDDPAQNEPDNLTVMYPADVNLSGSSYNTTTTRQEYGNTFLIGHQLNENDNLPTDSDRDEDPSDPNFIPFPTSDNRSCQRKSQNKKSSNGRSFVKNENVHDDDNARSGRKATDKKPLIKKKHLKPRGSVSRPRSGRHPKDSVWDSFNIDDSRINGKKKTAQCKICKTFFNWPKVERLKLHIKYCNPRP